MSFKYPLGKRTHVLSPFDPESFVWLQINRPGVHSVQRLTFPTSTGRTYRVESTPTLYSNDWITIFSNLPGLGTNRSLTHTRSAEPVYFRVGVVRP